MEKGGERWSKPHVATLSLHSLFELRKCIEKGTIMLDMEASTLPQVVGELPAAITNTQITTLDSTSVPDQKVVGFSFIVYFSVFPV